MSKVNNMASKVDWYLHQVSAIIYLLCIHVVDAYYCDNDRCTEEEYCCGDNTCCPSYKVWELWYFWCGVLFFMFLLTMCACLWRYRFLSEGPVVVSGYNYTALQDGDVMGQYQELPASGRHGRNNKLFMSPLDAPPLYNQGSMKFAVPPSTYAQVVGMRESY